MVLTGLAMMAHGSMMLDPDKEGLPEGAAELHHKALELTRRILALQPSLVVLTTPHGMSMERDVGVYLNEEVAGSAQWNGSWTDYSVKVNLASKRAQQLKAALQEDGVNSQGVIAHTSCAGPLCWAEVVPIHFLQRCGYTGDLVVMSLPQTRDYWGMAVGKDLVPTLHAAGRRLAAYCDRGGMWHDERVFILCSGDLAHGHSTTQPDQNYLPDPRWHLTTNDADSRLFDALVERWVLDSERALGALADACLELEKTAQSCAMTGLLLAEAAMHAYAEPRGRPFQGDSLLVSHPTYFTMPLFLFLQPSAASAPDALPSDDGGVAADADACFDADSLSAKRDEVRRRIADLRQGGTR